MKYRKKNRAYCELTAIHVFLLAFLRISTASMADHVTRPQMRLNYSFKSFQMTSEISQVTQKFDEIKTYREELKPRGKTVGAVMRNPDTFPTHSSTA